MCLRFKRCEINQILINMNQHDKIDAIVSSCFVKKKTVKKLRAHKPQLCQNKPLSGNCSTRPLFPVLLEVVLLLGQGLHRLTPGLVVFLQLPWLLGGSLGVTSGQCGLGEKPADHLGGPPQKKNVPWVPWLLEGILLFLGSFRFFSEKYLGRLETRPLLIPFLLNI